MTRWFALVLVATLLLGGATRAPAQSVAPQTAASAVSPQQAAEALAVLRDDARRAEMISVLDAIARAAPGAVTAAPAGATTTGATTTGATTTGTTTTGKPAAVTGGGSKPATATATTAPAKLVIPLAPDSLGAEVLVEASGWLADLSAGLGDTARTLTNFTLVSRWLHDLATDPDSRAELLDASWKLLVAALIALGTEFVLARLLSGVGRALARAAPVIAGPDPTLPHARRTAAMLLLRRVPFVLVRLLLDLLPVMAAAAVGYALLGTKIGEQSTTRLVILAVLNAYVVCRVLTSLTRAMVSPNEPRLRLLHITDGTAAYILRWLRRIAVVALFGYAATEVALLFGLYRVAHDALLKLVALACHAMLVIVVLQKRAAVRRLIRAPEGRRGAVATARNWLAPAWHFIAIFYICALWVVWALEVPSGFTRLVLVFVSTSIAVNLGRLLSVLLVGALDHALTLDANAARRYPGMEQTARRYLPALRVVINGVILTGGGIVLLQIWGLGSFSWFSDGSLGTRLVSACITIAITLLVALLVWEASNAAVQNHLARLTRESQGARSARLRTLLPMLRTALLVAIVLFAGLTILSQIGVNIAPLLAGAGVVGLAIGFGSQKLVQDIITGLFLLLENTMQVGDVVTLGGMTGTVENLSIRTIRLRALDGAVHIVPFSAVTTVTNMTRDFAYALLDVSVGLNEEPDHVASLVEEVADAMRRENRWNAAIAGDLEILGVERFIDTAWVLRLRLKTVPSQRWAVSRELNKRIKACFDARAVESPFTSYRALAAAAPPPPNAKTADEPGVAAA